MIVGTCCCNIVQSYMVLGLLWKLLSYAEELQKNFWVFSSNGQAWKVNSILQNLCQTTVWWHLSSRKALCLSSTPNPLPHTLQTHIQQARNLSRILQSSAQPHESAAWPLQRAAHCIKMTQPLVDSSAAVWENVNKAINLNNTYLVTWH